MKYTRVLLSLLLALTLILPLASCDGGKYRDDLTAAQLTDSITAALPAGDGWRQVSNAYISPSSWGEDYADYLAKVDEYRILVSENSDSNMDEVGVFLCNFVTIGIDAMWSGHGFVRLSILISIA